LQADDAFLHRDCVLHFCYEEVWDEYMTEIESMASQLPYMTAPGNHEVECHDPACLTDATLRAKLSNFSAYNTRFRMPAPESGGTLNMHYSFNYGPVHFVTIDTETGYPGAAEEVRAALTVSHQCLVAQCCVAQWCVSQWCVVPSHWL
jgi:acid phosphatase type 7